MKAIITHAHKATNTGKIALLDALGVEYRAYLRKCLQKMIADRKIDVHISERRNYFPQAQNLSSQIVKNIQAHAVFIMDSWVRSLYARKLRNKIPRTENLTDQQRIELRCCGKRVLLKPGVQGRMVLTPEMFDLYWSWVWNPEISGSPPEPKNPDFPMWMSEMTCEVQETKHAGLSKWWFKFSSLIKRKTTWVPLAFNPRMKSESVAKSVLVKKRKGIWTFQFTDKTPDQELDGTRGKIGLDVGLNVLAATSDGGLYGKAVKPAFDRLYEKVKELRANRQRQGFTENSPRLDRLEEKLSGLIKTAVGTVTSQLVKKYPGFTFVIEDLDLRGCKGQKRFAYRALHRSLATKAVVEVVNPAYSSQTCPSCGYVNRNNRHGTGFECRSCGRKGHADVMGAMNLLGRSGDKQIRSFDHPSVLKALLRKRYFDRRSAKDSFSTRDSVAVPKPRRGRGRPRKCARTVEPEAYCEEKSHSLEGDT
jgi:transposase